MFVLPEARGRGIGRALLAAIEQALAGRVATLRLETGIKQLEAIRLYEAAGFRRRGPGDIVAAAWRRSFPRS